MLIFKDVNFDAAHLLPKVPNGHPCKKLHGHTYTLRVYVKGTVQEETGWVMDFGQLKKNVQEIIGALDHQYLNEIPGLENPTCEHIVIWIWEQLKNKIPGLAKLELMETTSAGAVYEGD
ncbi:MAG TPA: 6-carboxytetrahydropterin synthase QueD [Puia sp.]|nr:6-carboxytetrahydropterin synthase QueD [Puia sp.]